MLPEILEAWTPQGKVGDIILSDGQLSTDTPGLEDVIQVRLRSQGSAEQAFRSLDGYNNGYFWITRAGKDGGAPGGSS